MRRRPRHAAFFGTIVVIALIACSPTAPTQAQGAPAAVSPSTTTRLFDGRSLANFDTWLVDHHEKDPEGVFSVVQVDGAPAIKITGKVWGGLITKQAFRDYRFTAEFRWGGPTWGDRATRARDSGVLLHAQGRLGNTARDFNGPWLRSVEFQIIEGGVGDVLPVAGFGEDGTQIRPVVKVRSRKDRDGENVFDPNGVLNTFSGGRINWFGRSEDWEDRIGFRGAHDVETGNLGWTTIEADVRGADLTYYVNGTLVNAASESSFTDGRIMIQSEGAEIYFRRIDVAPAR